MNRPPHFPDPDADPITVLEARIADQDDIITAQYREMTAWKTQLETAMGRVTAAEEQRDRLLAASSQWRVTTQQVADGLRRMADGLEEV